MKKFFLYASFLVAGTILPHFIQANNISAPAKYVFFFIGDGMGLNQVVGTEMYQAQLKGQPGTIPLSFTQYPVTGFAKTYSQSHPITDSAAGGTALATGEKTANGTIGMDYTRSRSLESVAEKAKKDAKSVGIVTSVSIDHATPASFYAHQPSRKMYYEIGTDLAKSGFDFFAGSDFLSPTNRKDDSQPNLFALVQDSGYVVARGIKDYEHKKDSSEKLILLQESGKEKASLPYALDRASDDLSLPTLTEKAIEFLSKENRGFFLMVEGGKIDWTSHNNDGATTFHEVLDFDQAIQVAYRFYQQHPDSTLIVVTADHETGGLGMGNSGYNLSLKLLASQKQSQEQLYRKLDNWMKKYDQEMDWPKFQLFLKENLGFWEEISMTEKEEMQLKESFEKLLHHTASNVKNEYSQGLQPAALAIEILNRKSHIGWTSKTHTAAYVPVYAIGAGAQLFQGMQENVDIPKRISQVAGY